jgi:hypothetical protein
LGDGQFSPVVSSSLNLSSVLPFRLFHEKYLPAFASFLFAPTLQVAHNVPEGKPKFTNGCLFKIERILILNCPSTLLFTDFVYNCISPISLLDRSDNKFISRSFKCASPCFLKLYFLNYIIC